MRKIFSLFAFLLITCSSTAQIIAIPDANFKARLLAATPSNTIAYNGMDAIRIDSNNNNEIEVSEALQVTGLNVSIADIYTVTGIEFFANLRSLNCSQNHIASLDVANLTNLKSLYCNLNLLTSLHLNGLTNLITLECAENTLTQIDFGAITGLENLNCRFNFLTDLQLNAFGNLRSLNCDYNQLPILNVGNLTQLTYLACQSNQLPALDLSFLPNLTSVNCSFNQLNALDLSSQNDLTILNCSHNAISTLDLTNLLQLSLLNCEFNQIANGLVFDNMPELESAYCHNNLIPFFNFNGVPNLQVLDCSANQVHDLDVSPASLLSVLNCHNNVQLVNLNIKNGSNEPFLDFSNDPNLAYVCADDSQLPSIQNLIAQYGYTNCQANSSCDLSAVDLEMGNRISIFPNPAKAIVNLSIQQGITLKSIAIYDLIGQTIMAIPQAENVSELNLSDLKSGVYFMAFTTDKEIAVQKFIKE